MLLSMLVACKDNTPEEQPAPQSTESDSTPAAKEYVVLYEKDVDPVYQVLYASNIDALTKTSVTNLASKIADKFNIFVKEMAISEDFDIVQEKEILIGNTARPESAEAAALLQGKSFEYAIKLCDNGKLAIVASNATSLSTAVNDFTLNYVTNGDANKLALEEGFELYVDLSDTVNVKWRLPKVPEYKGGILAAGSYAIGHSLAANSNSGTMHVISKTNLEEFNSYLETLKSEGFNEIATNEINGNKYVQFTYPTNNQTLYTYYLASHGEVRVISDNSSVPENLTEYEYTPKEGEYAAVYQFAMMFDPRAGGSGNSSDGRYPNNGNFIIIKLSDNKVILIDGGGPQQATDDATEALIDFLYEITGKDREAGEKITVAAWHLTHYHGDHWELANKLFSEHSDIIELERVIHNLTTAGVAKSLKDMSQNIIKNYPERQFIKCHTGQKIQLGDVTIEVLLTHEDLVNPETSSSLIMEGNDTSTILKFTFSDGRTFLSLGDWGGDWSSINEPAVNRRYYENEERFLAMYRDKNGKYPFLKSDIVQVSHHAINDWMRNIYNAIDADYAFIPQADVAYKKYLGSCFMAVIDQLKATGMPEDHIFHANRITHGLLLKDTIEHTMQGITGYDKAYYYYTDASGKKLYMDAEGKVTTTETGNTLITDTNGKQTFAGFTDAKAVYVKGYMDYVNKFEPFYNFEY